MSEDRNGMLGGSLQNGLPASLVFVNGVFTQSQPGTFTAMVATDAKVLFAAATDVTIAQASAATTSVIGVLKGAMLTLDGAAGGYKTDFDIGKGSTFALDTALHADLQGSVIQFGQVGGTLDVNAANLQFVAGQSAVITKFAAGDTIDAQGTVITSYAFDKAMGMLVLFDGTTRVGELQFKLPAGSDPTFVLTSDRNGGTNITLAAPCFAAGTRVLTRRGEVAVEDLVVGDKVVTLSGKGPALKPVVWIGRRRVDIAGHTAPDKVRPVRVSRGALAENVPHRDLVLSPDHALFLDGMLIPAKVLANGATIVPDERSEITYFHVELESHDVLLAEGAPAESYLDTGNRDCFANGGLFTVLHPDFAAKSWENACAPLAVSGARVAAVREGLRARALAAGFELDHDPALCVAIKGAVLRAEPREDGRYRFVLPAGARDVEIRSHAAVPADVTACPDDRRRLGVALAAVVVETGTTRHDVALDSAAWGAGLHGVETAGDRSWRWTDGAALLALPAGASVLEIELAGTLPGWTLPSDDAAESLRA